MKYYGINESAARAAKNASSFSDYVEGSATAEYRRMVDKATQIAEAQKARVPAEFHAKIDGLLDRYARKLADNMNRRFSIDARVPSILIAGGSNFPVKKKEKQNAARDVNYAEYQEIEAILDRIRSTGTGGIMSDDKNALAKLCAKLEKLEKRQALMKAANAAIRMKDTEAGNAKLAGLGFSEDEIRQLREPDYCGRIGYPAYELQNNNANIHRVRDRIAALEKEAQRAKKNADAEPVTGDGYKLVENTDIGRIQFLFDDKPSEDTRALLKSYGFRWSPSQGAWQRMLNDNGRYAAQRTIKKMAGS